MTEKTSDGKTLVNLSKQQLPDLPIKTATAILTQTDGEGLLQNARTNRALAEAVMFGFAWTARWNNPYVGKKVNRVLNLSISSEGQGRRDIIDCLQAGGTVPDAYYTGGEKKPTGSGDTAYVREY